MLRNSTHKFRAKYHPRTNISPTRRPQHLCQSIYLASPNIPASDASFYPLNKSSYSHRKTELSPRHLAKTQGLKTATIKTQFRESRENGKTLAGIQAQLSTQKVESSTDGEISISELRWRPAKGSSIVLRNPQLFIEQLPKNSVFYCCMCFQYVFEIEKGRHYPECKDRVTFTNYEREKIIRVCWERLQRVMELAKYSATKAREVEDLYNQAKQGVFSRMLIINYPKNCRFFTLAEIQQAFVYTYQQLLKGRIYTQKPSFFNC